MDDMDSSLLTIDGNRSLCLLYGLLDDANQVRPTLMPVNEPFLALVGSDLFVRVLFLFVNAFCGTRRAVAF